MVAADDEAKGRVLVFSRMWTSHKHYRRTMALPGGTRKEPEQALQASRLCEWLLMGQYQEKIGDNWRLKLISASGDLWSGQCFGDFTSELGELSSLRSGDIS
jgi:hypothetical protein